MSNLGSYQWITRTSKRFGGPPQLLAIVAVGGYIVFRSLEAGGVSVFKATSKKQSENSEPPHRKVTYFIFEDSDFGNDLLLKTGAEFSVLAEDGDTTLIVIEGNPNNPHAVSTQLLISNSDYKGI